MPVPMIPVLPFLQEAFVMPLPALLRTAGSHTDASGGSRPSNAAAAGGHPSITRWQTTRQAATDATNATTTTPSVDDVGSGLCSCRRQRIVLLMSLLAVRGGCLRNVRGVGMMVLMQQTAVDGTVQVVSAASTATTRSWGTCITA